VFVYENHGGGEAQWQVETDRARAMETNGVAEVVLLPVALPGVRGVGVLRRVFTAASVSVPVRGEFVTGDGSEEQELGTCHQVFLTPGHVFVTLDGGECCTVYCALCARASVCLCLCVWCVWCVCVCVCVRATVPPPARHCMPPSRVAMVLLPVATQPHYYRNPPRGCCQALCSSPSPPSLLPGSVCVAIPRQLVGQLGSIVT
jgi:hypothetical protein